MMASSEPWLTLHRTFDAALPVLRDPGKETYIVRDDAGMAAFIILDMRGPLAGYIQTVCVRADQRGKGIGSVLIVGRTTDSHGEPQRVHVRIVVQHRGASAV